MASIKHASWFASATILTSAAGFLAQIALGWILTKHEFGVYALTMALTISIAAFKNGGIQQVLIQQGNVDSKFISKLHGVGLIINTLSLGVLSSVGLYAAGLYGFRELVPLSFLLGCSVVLATPSVILKAKVQILGEFKLLSAVTAIVDVSRHALIVVFAILGFGVFSFVVPSLIAPIIMGLLFYLAIRTFPSISMPSFADLREVIGETKWIMLSNLAVALRQNGQYVAISIAQSSVALGIYFFSMQLVMRAASVFTATINEVAFPKLAAMNGSQGRYENAFLMGVRIGFAIGVLIAVSAYAVAPDVIKIVWGGRWNEAIHCVLPLSAGVPAMILSSMCLTAFASKGLWRSRLALQSMLAAGDIVVAGLAAFNLDIYGVAAAITLYRSIATTIIFLIAVSRLGMSIGATLRRMVDVLTPVVLVGLIVLGGYSGLLDKSLLAVKLLLVVGLAVYYFRVINLREFFRRQ